MRICSVILLLTCGALLLPAPTAALVVVSPDGSGDYPTLQAAIHAAPSGETIELTDGVFVGQGNRDLSFVEYWTGTLRSQSGDPAACYLNLDGHAIGSGQGMQEITFDGVGFRNGSGGYTAGMWGGVIFENCDFENVAWVGRTNESGVRLENCTVTGATEILATFGSAAFYGCHLHGNAAIARGYSVRLVDCTVEDNVSESPLVSVMSSMLYGSCGLEECRNCLFADNQAPQIISGSGIRCNDCTFAGNEGQTIEWLLGGAEPCEDLILEGCTFASNAAPGSAQLVTDGWEDSSEVERRVDNCLIAFNDGAAVEVHSPLAIPEISCGDIYGNSSGDWAGMIADQLGLRGNICEDPLLCSLAGRDLHLRDGSPCAPFSPPNEECALIGVWPVGCSASAPESALRAPTPHLMRPCPNPFSTSTRIEFAAHIPSGEPPLSLVVCDVTGRTVRHLVQPSLAHSSGVAGWDGTDDRGASLPSGLYHCRLRLGRHVLTQPMLLVR